MKFTDSFFEFPVRIYDGIQIRSEIGKEDEEETGEPLWMVSKMRIPVEELYALQWHEYFWDKDMETARDREADKKNTGLDCTIVKIKGDEYMSPLTKDKFEERLNAFMDKFTKSLELENGFEKPTVG